MKLEEMRKTRCAAHGTCYQGIGASLKFDIGDVVIVAGNSALLDTVFFKLSAGAPMDRTMVDEVSVFASKDVRSGE